MCRAERFVAHDSERDRSESTESRHDFDGMMEAWDDTTRYMGMSMSLPLSPLR